ncbi:uncharacterized protein LOC115082325 isoform X5 [Rhinatrema bivittatum]|nr:uncharacterized protein LOC115082325 isoform X5 [Rhinatrema bivittatum]
MWKPLEKKDANGKILGYRLISQRKGRRETGMTLECITDELQCALMLSEEEFTIFLTAYNSAGESPSAKIIIPAAAQAVTSNSLLSVLVSPVDDHSLVLHWAAPLLRAASYIFEWFEEPGKPSRNVSWHYEAGSINYTVIKDAFEPGRLYNLSVHALSDGDVWASGTTCSYSKQMDDGEVELLVSSVFIGLALLLIFAVLACIYKHQLIKALLWPQVPDPTNTNLGSWKPRRIWMQNMLYPPMEQTEKLRMCLTWFPSSGNPELKSATHEETKMYFVEKTWRSDTYEQTAPAVIGSDLSAHPESGQRAQAHYPNEVQYSAVIVHAYGLSQRDPVSRASNSAILHHESCGSHPPWLEQNAPLEGDLEGLCVPCLELPGEDPASFCEFPFLMALMMEDDTQPGQNHHPVTH